ncbi:MAG: hypothetical protein EAY65_02425 [Alphaproteobacteria bacterium]|nr:MAG: hypothetical protein EAY65_02425 [Alphaproteobacteria bacterium]
MENTQQQAQQAQMVEQLQQAGVDQETMQQFMQAQQLAYAAEGLREQSRGLTTQQNAIEAERVRADKPMGLVKTAAVAGVGMYAGNEIGKRAVDSISNFASADAIKSQAEKLVQTRTPDQLNFLEKFLNSFGAHFGEGQTLEQLKKSVEKLDKNPKTQEALKELLDNPAVQNLKPGARIEDVLKAAETNMGDLSTKLLEAAKTDAKETTNIIGKGLNAAREVLFENPVLDKINKEAKKAFDATNVAGAEGAAEGAAQEFQKLKIETLNDTQRTQFYDNVKARVGVAGKVTAGTIAAVGTALALKHVMDQNAGRVERLNALDGQIEQLQNATFDTNEQARQADMIAQNLQMGATMSWQQKMAARGLTPRGAGQQNWAESVAQEQSAPIALG